MNSLYGSRTLTSSPATKDPPTSRAVGVRPFTGSTATLQCEIPHILTRDCGMGTCSDPNGGLVLMQNSGFLFPEMLAWRSGLPQCGRPAWITRMHSP